jgi:hypothetical protein
LGRTSLSVARTVALLMVMALDLTRPSHGLASALACLPTMTFPLRLIAHGAIPSARPVGESDDV